jgi:hypothetical protein
MLSRAFCSVLLVLCAASACANVSCAKDGTQCTHAVVVSVDTLRRSALRAFDRDAPELSNVDRFATQSVRFMNAHSTAPWTLPAHASLLTGLYPDRHGATDWRQRIDTRVSTLVDLLHRSGFETVAFPDGGYVHPAFGFDSVFERYDHWVEDPDDRPRLNLPRDGKPTPAPGSVLFDRAIAFLGATNIEGSSSLLVSSYVCSSPVSKNAIMGSDLVTTTWRERSRSNACVLLGLRARAS